MAQPTARLVGERLVEKGLITEEQLKKAIRKQKTDPRPVGEILVSEGSISENQLIQVLSDQLGIPFIDVEYYKVDETILELFPRAFLCERRAVPLFRVQNTITVAMADPLDLKTVDRLAHLSKNHIQPVFGAPGAITQVLDRLYGAASSLDEEIEELSETAAGSELSAAPSGSAGPADAATKEVGAEEAKGLAAVAKQAPIIKLVDTILRRAVSARASDVHFEPDEGSTHVRYRVDGILYDMAAPPKRLEAAVISRFKIMAGLDIAERRLPQDGRFQVKFADHEVDFRISTFPTIYGENVAIRVLDKSAIMLSLEELGFLPEILENFKALVQRPNGLVLVTGPTGCGKTTTLYGALRTIDAVNRNVITLEDPVEYRIPRIRQSQIDVKAGLTFASGLRSLVRQDPDVIMIGEIRDRETAEIAIHAALTGHLVFSTLHTNDAPGALTRLIDMGVEPYLVSSALIGILAQRLVRRLCSECKKSQKATPELLGSLGLPSLPPGAKLFQAQGCKECNQSGYRGRIGIYELLQMSDALRQLTIAKDSSGQLRTQAVRGGMVSLRQAGITKALDGTTTIEEILRVTEHEVN